MGSCWRVQGLHWGMFIMCASCISWVYTDLKDQAACNSMRWWSWLRLLSLCRFFFLALFCVFATPITFFNICPLGACSSSTQTVWWSTWVWTTCLWAVLQTKPFAWWRRSSLWRPMVRSVQPTGPRTLLQWVCSPSEQISLLKDTFSCLYPDLLTYTFPAVSFVFRKTRCFKFEDLTGLTLFFRSNQPPKDPRSTLIKSTEEFHNIQI